MASFGRRQALEQPVREARRRNLHPPLRHVPARVVLGQLLGELDHLVPRRRALLGVEAGLLEGVLVPVENDRRALERHAPGLAAGAAVQHERLVEAVEPLPVVGALGDVVDRHDRLFVDEREHVGREQHRELRRLAALGRRQRLHDRLLVGARVDRVHLHVGVLLAEVGSHLVDRLRHRAADGDRVVEVDLGDLLRRRRQRRGDGGDGREGDAPCLSHVCPPCELDQTGTGTMSSRRRPLAWSNQWLSSAAQPRRRGAPSASA